MKFYEERMIREAFLLLIFLAGLIQVHGKDIYYRKYLGKQDGLKIYQFTIKGNQFAVGSQITVSFKIKNISNKDIKFGKYGAFVGCRDPSGKNKDFGHSFRNFVLKKGKSITITGTIKIDKAGVWSFWPAFYIEKKGWSFYKWHEVKLKAQKISVYKPPYINCDGWTTVKGIAKARYLCNHKTGYLALLMDTDTGGAAAETRQYLNIYVPENKKVKIKATFFYIGGSKTVGYGSFAGLQATYKFRKKYGRKDIEPGLNYQIAAEKIIDVALLAVPEGGEAKTVWQALKILSEIKDYYDIITSIGDAIKKGKGRTYTYTFSIKARKGYNIIGIGLRGNCSSVITGKSFVIVGAILKEVKVYY